MNDLPLISGQWDQVYRRMMDHFDHLPSTGRYVLTFSESPAFDEFYHVHMALEGTVLNIRVSIWCKNHDYRRWRTEVGFTPSVTTNSARLSEEDSADFSDFFIALMQAKEEELLDRTMRLILDGSQFRMKLLRDGEVVRSLIWNSAVEPVGLMNQVMRLSQTAREKSKRT